MKITVIYMKYEGVILLKWELTNLREGISFERFHF